VFASVPPPASVAPECRLLWSTARRLPVDAGRALRLRKRPPESLKRQNLLSFFLSLKTSGLPARDHSVHRRVDVSMPT